MRLSVQDVRPSGCLKGVVVCTFMGDDGVIGVVLQLDPVHARATAASLLRAATDAEREVEVGASVSAGKAGGT